MSQEMPRERKQARAEREMRGRGEHAQTMSEGMQRTVSEPPCSPNPSHPHSSLPTLYSLQRVDYDGGSSKSSIELLHALPEPVRACLLDAARLCASSGARPSSSLPDAHALSDSGKAEMESLLGLASRLEPGMAMQLLSQPHAGTGWGYRSG